MTAAQRKAVFGSVIEISGVDYVDQVNKAGDGVWVVLHLYKPGYTLCINIIAKKIILFAYVGPAFSKNSINLWDILRHRNM